MFYWTCKRYKDMISLVSFRQKNNFSALLLILVSFINHSIFEQMTITYEPMKYCSTNTVP